MIEFTDTEYCAYEECDNEVKEEGDTCAECRATEAEYRKEWEHSGQREYERAQTYVQDMKDAGREHLLTEEERGQL